MKKIEAFHYLFFSDMTSISTGQKSHDIKSKHQQIVVHDTLHRSKYGGVRDSNGFLNRQKLRNME